MKVLKLARFFMTAPGWMKGPLIVVLFLALLLGLVLLPVFGILLLVLAVVAGIVALIVLPIRGLVNRVK